MEKFKFRYSENKKISIIYYYIQKVLKDLTLEYKKYIEYDSKYICFDMYSPKINLAIEYDRYVRNNDALKLNIEQERYLTQYVNLIKIRENKLQCVNYEYDTIYKFKELHINTSNENSINLLINEILNELSENYNVKIKDIDIDIDRDIDKITSSYYSLKESKSFKNKYPKIYNELYRCLDDNINIKFLKPMSNVKVEWKCKRCGQIWESTIAYRTIQNKDCCPYCNNRKVLPGYNDLATTNIDLANQWHPTKNENLKPTDVTAGSSKKVWWICSKGHEWQAIIKNRTHANNNCPYCGNKKVLPGYNDLATTNTDLANQWHPTKNGNLKPTDITAGSSKKVWWICSKGHEWETSISTRSRTNRNCPFCYSKKDEKR